MATGHVCTVKQGSQSYLPPLSKDAYCLRRAFRRFQQWLLVSPHNPLCTVYFKSSAAVALERKRHVKSGLLYIIHPFSLFRMYWEIWMIPVFLSTLVVNPLEVMFEFGRPVALGGISGFVVTFDIICLIDMVVDFFTGYCISSTKEVILDPVKIAKHYFFSLAFVCDLLSSIPIRLIRYMIEDLLSLYVWHIVDIFSLMKIFRFNTFLLYFRSTADIFRVGLMKFLIMKYCVIFIVVLHWTACIHYAVPTIIAVVGNQKLHEKSWIVQANLNSSDWKPGRLYLRCLFRACCYLFSINHGIYDPFTPEDLFVGIVSFIIGTILLALMLMLILELMSSVFSAETKYQEIMNQVQEYMGYKQLPLNMQKRLICYYEYRFQKKYFREGAILATLSERLRREINVYCYRRLVDSVSIFKDLPHHIMVDIVNSLKAEIFLPNDIIVRAGTIGDCMYFLSSGTVSVFTPTGKEVCHLYDGAYFGEVALLIKDQKRIASVIAIEICEVYKLDRKSFKTCFLLNNANWELYRKIERVAEERRERTLLLEEMHKKYLMALDQTSLDNHSTSS